MMTIVRLVFTQTIAIPSRYDDFDYFHRMRCYNQYKTLSRREFVDVMKARLQRGLDRQRGIEFTAKLWALGSCACETYAPESVKNVYNLVAEKLETQSKAEEKKAEE